MTLDLYTSRTARPCKELVYSFMMPACRTQIVNIIKAFFSDNHLELFAEEHIWPNIHKALKDEHGTDSLYRESAHRAFGGRTIASEEVLGYLLSQDDIGKSLDTIELSFQIIVKIESHLSKGEYHEINYPSAKAIEDLNKRLAQHCMGYKFDGGMIVRIDNELLFRSITQPVMMFLSNPLYHNINEEYLQAHKHLRDGNYKDSIVNCAKAFESTMKVICDQKSYPYSQKDTAVVLLKVLYDNKFIPDYLQADVNGLRSVLGDSVSVIRNKTSAHGAGSAVIDVSEALAAFTLNSAGSIIKFLLTILEVK